MKVPILLPNIFNHPFTYESDINLKVLPKYGFLRDRSIPIAKSEIAKFNGDIKKSTICFNNSMLLPCKKRDSSIMSYLSHYSNVLLVFTSLFFSPFISANASYSFVDVVSETTDSVVAIGLYFANLSNIGTAGCNGSKDGVHTVEM